MRSIIRTSAKLVLTATAAVALFAAGVGAFVVALGLSEVYADEMVIEKRVEERRVVEPAPAVIEKKVVEEKVEAVPAPVVVKERTVVEKAPPAAVIEKRVEEHVIEDD